MRKPPPVSVRRSQPVIELAETEGTVFVSTRMPASLAQTTPSADVAERIAGPELVCGTPLEIAGR
jgi:hypothetical protein